jgi:hypothetical protein
MPLHRAMILPPVRESPARQKQSLKSLREHGAQVAVDPLSSHLVLSEPVKLERCLSRDQSEILRSPSDFEHRGQIDTEYFSGTHISEASKGQLTHSGRRNFPVRSAEDIRTQTASPSEWALVRCISPSLYRQNSKQFLPAALFRALQTAIDRLFDREENVGD